MQRESSMKHIGARIHTEGGNLQALKKACVLAVAAAFTFTTGTAFAQPSPAVKEDQAQLTSDKAALHRELEQLEADEAALKSDTASGRMSAESKDAYEVYLDRQAVKGEKKVIAADKVRLQADQKK